MTIFSYILSCILHTILLIVIIVWPAKTLVDINKAPIQISLTLGDMGGDNLASAVLGKQKRLVEKKIVPKVETTKTVALAKPKTEAPKPEPKKIVPKERVDVKAPQKPVAKPIATPQPKPTPEKPKTSPEDALKKALTDSTQSVEKVPEVKKPRAPRKPRSPIAGALASLKENVKRTDAEGGGGGTGAGPGGGGLHDVYTGMVMLAIRPNWSMPTYSRENLIAYVRVNLSPEGEVKTASIEQSSGRADFDASAVNAVIRTKQLPKPPSPEHQELVIAFNSLEIAR